MLAAIMIHGVIPGPLLIAERPEIFWGFIASMYVGNVVLLILNLPLVGLFIQVLRIPYRYLYPLILTLCVIGVYAVGQSVVDVWIMIAMGALGYLLKNSPPKELLQAIRDVHRGQPSLHPSLADVLPLARPGGRIGALSTM